MIQYSFPGRNAAKTGVDVFPRLCAREYYIETSCLCRSHTENAVEIYFRFLVLQMVQILCNSSRNLLLRNMIVPVDN
jgi:hypothetical protein